MLSIEIPQLAHVARPRIVDEHLHRLGRDAVERAVVLLPSSPE